MGYVAANGVVVNRTPISYTSGPNRPTVFSNNTGSKPSIKQLQAMGSVGTLFSIVNRTSTATGAVEWKLYRKRTPRQNPKSPRVEVKQHAALQVWNKPNAFFTRQTFVETFQQHQDLTGESWWVIGRAEGFNLPLELWPVRPDRMEPVPHPTEFLAGYIYTSPDGEKIALNLDQVIQIKLPNPMDPYRGMGPVQAILADIDSARYSAEWNRNFFLNGAEPGGLVKLNLSNPLSDTDYRTLQYRWNEMHKGVENAHRVGILEMGEWVERKFSQKDMQFIELQNVSREIMREALGMSKTMLGLTEDVNRATAQTAEYVFAKYQSVPRLERIKGALNNNFLPMFGSTGDNVEFDYESPVPEDEEAENQELQVKTQAASTLVSAGWHPDDVLMMLELPPMRFERRIDGQAALADGEASGSAAAGS